MPQTTLLSPEKVAAKQKLQYPVRILEFLVGAGGFEQVVLFYLQIFVRAFPRSYVFFRDSTTPIIPVESYIEKNKWVTKWVCFELVNTLPRPLRQPVQRRLHAPRQRGCTSHRCP